MGTGHSRIGVTKDREVALALDSTRALDAIHLATALDLEMDGLVLITYDERQADGGRTAGLDVVSPA